MSMGIDSLRARSGACFPGLEPEVAPLLDVMLPSERVVDAIKPLRGSFQRSHCDYTSAHPLAASQVNAPDAARPSSTRSHRLFYIHRRPGLWRHRRSRLADLGSEHDPLLAGFGWGNMRNRPRRSNGRSAKASKSAQSGGVEEHLSWGATDAGRTISQGNKKIALQVPAPSRPGGHPSAPRWFLNRNLFFRPNNPVNLTRLSANLVNRVNSDFGLCSGGLLGRAWAVVRPHEEGPATHF